MSLFSKLFRPKRRADHPLCCAIVPAGGSSTRMGGENKLLMPLNGAPVLVRTLFALECASLVDEIIVAVREQDLLPVGALCKEYGLLKPVKLVLGGNTRLQSVLAAVSECRVDAAFLAVHDGDRPLAEPEFIDSVIALAHRTNAAAPALPLKDTVKIVRDGAVVSTPDRDSLRAVQTPQVFEAHLLRAALLAAGNSGDPVYDDCSAVERLGKTVYLTDGSPENIKITTPDDLFLAEAILQRREGLL